MTELILVRHGETDWNRARRIQGATDIPLNDTGRTQAAETAAELRASIRADVPLIVTSSDLVRAQETARIIATGLGTTLHGVYPELRERAYGDAEGAHVDDLRERWGEWHDADLRGVEPWAEVRSRGVRGLLRIARDARRGTAPVSAVVVAVSHGGMIRELIRHASGGTLPLAGERIGNGSLHRFVVDRHSMRLLSSAMVAAPA